MQGGIKSSGLAAVLSFFWCGLGQVYLGQFGTGIALMLGPPVMLFLGLALTFRGCLSDAGGASRARTHFPAHRVKVAVKDSGTSPTGYIEGCSPRGHSRLGRCTRLDRAAYSFLYDVRGMR